jgi:hypothetical protein
MCAGRGAAAQISLRNLRTLDCVAVRGRPRTFWVRDGPGSAVHHFVSHRVRDKVEDSHE